MLAFQIVWKDILPLFILVAAGYVLDSRFKLDVNTYAKITTRVVLPVFIFYSTYRYVPDSSTPLLIFAGLALLILNGLASWISAKLFGFTGNDARIFQALSTFSYAGQTGTALILLLFSDVPYLLEKNAPFLQEAQHTMMTLWLLMNIAITTLGAALLETKKLSLVKILRSVCSTPTIYAVIAACFLKSASLSLESTCIWPVLSHFTGAALILITVTAGAEFHRTPQKRPGLMSAAVFLHRFILSPFFACLIIWTTGIFTPASARAFFICAALPASLTLIPFALDFCRLPDTVTRSVLYSFAIGTIALICAFRLALYLFPAGV